MNSNEEYELDNPYGLETDSDFQKYAGVKQSSVKNIQIEQKNPIASVEGSIIEYVTNNQNGFLFSNGNE